MSSVIDTWPMIRPGSNVSALYFWFSLFIINKWLSSSILYCAQIIVVLVILVILVINFFVFSHTLLFVGYLHPLKNHKSVTGYMQWMYHLKRKILVPFMMIPTLELMFRFATHRFRRLPDFYVFGEMKCGTSTLSQLLNKMGCQGPFSMINHFMSVHKESNWFLGIQGFRFATAQYYSLCFPFKWLNTATLFDASPDRLWFPHIFKRVHSVTPKAKIIIMIRNPIERTKSHLQHNMYEAAEAEHELNFGRNSDHHCTLTQSIEWYRNNKQVVERYLDELEALDINAKVPEYIGMLWCLPIIQRSLYYRNVQRLLKVFDRKQLLFVDVEELNTDLYATLTKICEFVDYEVDERLLRKICELHCKQKYHANKALVKVEMTDAERQALYDIFKVENEKLFSFLGRDLGWNNA